MLAQLHAPKPILHCTAGAVLLVQAAEFLLGWKRASSLANIPD